MSFDGRPPAIVSWTLRLEAAAGLDAPVRAIEPAIRAVFGTGRRAALLRGDWLGHAIHPVLTDLVIGTWTSTTVLDLLGGSDSTAPAQRLLGVGLLAAGPTAWTGWAEWSAAGERDKRVGLVHAVTNGLAVGIYTASWVASFADAGLLRNFAPRCKYYNESYKKYKTEYAYAFCSYGYSYRSSAGYSFM